MALDLDTRATGGYPADLRGAAGVKIVKTGLRADLSLELRDVQKLPTAPTGGLVPVQDPVTGLIQALDFAQLPTSNPADGSVANAKLTAVPSLTVKGNTTNANAQPQDVPLSTIAGAGNPVGDAIQARALNAFKISVATAAIRDVFSKLDSTPIRPQDFGDPNATSDHTAMVQSAIDAGIAQYPRAVDLSGQWRVTKITATGGNGLLLSGISTLVGIATTSQTAILEITMGGVIQDGQIKAVAQYNDIYDRGIWLYSTTTKNVQYSIYSGLFHNGSKAGLEVGNVSFPSGLNSEITIIGGGTYGCPTALKVSGTETYVAILGGTWSGDSFGGNAAWQARPKRVCVNIGAHLTFGQGEAIITSDFNGYVFEKQPLTGTLGEGTIWGTVICLGTFIETAAPVMIATNPTGLTINSLAGNRGLTQFIGCRGFHSQDREAFISLPADYDGRVRVLASSWWKPGAARTQPDIFCAGGGPKVDVYMDDMGFGDGFKNGLTGVIGGILHFTQRQLLRVLTLTNQAIPANQAGGTPLLFQAADPTGDNARWSPNYTPATGIYTFSQAHEDVEIDLFCSVPSVNGTLYLSLNGGLGRARPFISGTGTLRWCLKRVSKNDTIQAVLGATNSGTADSSLFTSEMTITGRGAPN